MFQDEIQTLEQYKSFGYITIDDAIKFCKRVIETENTKNRKGKA